jgi:hypothetical protein
MKITIGLRALLLTVSLALSVTSASAQAPPSDDEWKVTLYPIFGWIPIFGADVNVPSLPSPGGGGGGGESSTEASTDSKLNAALMFGFSVTYGPWRTDVDGMWAALTGDRPSPPRLKVDLDFIYGHVSGGRKLVKDLYATVGVRRLAMKYDIQLGDLPTFSRKPGLWDPLVGVGWHHQGRKVELHASLEGGGFGVGADEDIFAGIRVDLKPVSHIGITLGYAAIHVKLTDTVLTKTFTASQTLHGPIVGIGVYF